MLEILGGIFLAIVIADLTAAFFHWSEDRWGDPKWETSKSWAKRKIYQYIIGPNILHHKRPAAMTEGNYWTRNNSTIILSLILAFSAYLLWPNFWPLWLGFIFLSQANEMHSWSHLPKNKLSPIIRFLQKIKILQTPQHHKIHHTVPYNRNYGVMTNFLNPILTFIFFWPTLEFIVWLLTGITPVKEREIF